MSGNVLLCEEIYELRKKGCRHQEIRRILQERYGDIRGISARNIQRIYDNYLNRSSSTTTATKQENVKGDRDSNKSELKDEYSFSDGDDSNEDTVTLAEPLNHHVNGSLSSSSSLSPSLSKSPQPTQASDERRPRMKQVSRRVPEFINLTNVYNSHNLSIHSKSPSGLGNGTSVSYNQLLRLINDDSGVPLIDWQSFITCPTHEFNLSALPTQAKQALCEKYKSERARRASTLLTSTIATGVLSDENEGGGVGARRFNKSLSCSSLPFSPTASCSTSSSPYSSSTLTTTLSTSSAYPQQQLKYLFKLQRFKSTFKKIISNVSVVNVGSSINNDGEHDDSRAVDHRSIGVDEGSSDVSLLSSADAHYTEYSKSKRFKSDNKLKLNLSSNSSKSGLFKRMPSTGPFSASAVASSGAVANLSLELNPDEFFDKYHKISTNQNFRFSYLSSTNTSNSSALSSTAVSGEQPTREPSALPQISLSKRHGSSLNSYKENSFIDLSIFPDLRPMYEPYVPRECVIWNMKVIL
jgi:hypothetical protein